MYFCRSRAILKSLESVQNAVEGIGAVHKLRPDVLFSISRCRASVVWKWWGCSTRNIVRILFFSPRLTNTLLKPLKNMPLIIRWKPIDEARLRKRWRVCVRNAASRMFRCYRKINRRWKFIPCNGGIVGFILLQNERCGICQQSDERCLRYQPRRERGLYRIDITYPRKVVHHYCAAIVSIWLTSRIYRRLRLEDNGRGRVDFA